MTLTRPRNIIFHRDRAARAQRGDFTIARHYTRQRAPEECVVYAHLRAASEGGGEDDGRAGNRGRAQGGGVFISRRARGCAAAPAARDKREMRVSGGRESAARARDTDLPTPQAG